MKILTMTAAAVTAAAAFALSPEPVTQKQSGLEVPSTEGLLRPGTDAAEAPRAGGEPLRPAFSRLGAGVDLDESLRARLTVEDLDQREVNFDAAVREAARDADAEAALESIARDLTHVDLAFTARLALREAKAMAKASQRQNLGRMGMEPFAAMQERMESMFGSDPFMGELFSGDPFFGRGLRRGTGFDPFAGPGSVDPFEAMRRRTEELRQQLQDLRAGGSPGPGASGFSSSSSMSVETTDDGVRVEITENDGSGPRTRVYTAPSMDDLLEANPELKGRVR